MIFFGLVCKILILRWRSPRRTCPSPNVARSGRRVWARASGWTTSSSPPPLPSSSASSSLSSSSLPASRFQNLTPTCSYHSQPPPVEQQEEPGIGGREADPHLVDVDERVEPGGDGSARPPWGTSCRTCLTGADPARPERLGQHVCLQVSSHFPLNLQMFFLLSAKRRTGA